MKNQWRFKKKLAFLNKYINGTNGVISLFLAILMVPFASIAGALVNSARINSSVAIFDEALCSASNSTLGTYDNFLRERFGLLAMDQNTASGGSGYSAQQLIQDTFSKYMDKNINVLSNTYDTSTVSATGVYPLADTDVLLSQIYEAGKYTVPAKLVTDGISLEDILNALTKDLSSVTSLFDSISSGNSIVDKVDNCDEKFTALSDKLENLNENKTNYDNAYNDFKDAVNKYNSLIDEINQKRIEIQGQIDELNTAIKEEEENWIKELNNLDNVDNYKKYISSLNVVGIGDSVMLGAVNNLYNTFPNGYFDAKVSRSMWAGITLLKELNEQNRLGDPIVMHLGANGDCSKECKIQIMKECKDRTVFWLNTTNLTSVNDSLKEFAKDYPNLHIIDWYSASKGHSNWFYADGIHLPEAGREAYTKLIYDNIYEVYKKKYKEKRDALVNEHKEELKSRISFYGNDILFYNFDALESNFESARLFVSKDYTYKTLKEKIESSVKENTLSNKIVLAFDNSMNMDLKSYQEIIELCKDSTIYIVSTSKLTNSLNNYSNVKIINFYSDIEKNKSYLEADMVHLTEKGNAALIEKLKENTSV